MKNIGLQNYDVETLQNMSTKLCILNDKFCYSIIPEIQIVTEIQNNVVSTDRLR